MTNNTIIDLTKGAWRGELREIAGGVASAATRCMVERLESAIRLTLDAGDPDMLALLATAPIAGRNDPLLYEEDCLQIAWAELGSAKADAFLVINPYGSTKASGKAATWKSNVYRHSCGWLIEVELPLPSRDCIGLSLHRFFRGVHGEVQGLQQVPPHPLEPCDFAVIVLTDGEDPATVAERFLQSARDASESALEARLAECRRTLSARQMFEAAPGEMAVRLVSRRAEVPIRPATMFLCWNEAYFQHALIDLWKLDGDSRWIEMALERGEGTWRQTGDRIGRVDAIWGQPRSTWYDPDDELGAGISLITGVILYPLTRLIHAAMTDDRLAGYRSRIAPWIDWCRSAIAVHDCEWIELPGRRGFYLEPYQKGPRRCYPTGGSRVAPLNRGIYLAFPQLYLGRLLGDTLYLDRVAKMARFWRGAWERQEEDDTVVWEYEVSRYPATGEDLSHAHSQILFTELCCREGIEFTTDDLRLLANTYARRVFRHGDVPCEYVRGFEPCLNPAVAAWTGLCRFVPEILPRARAVLESFYCLDQGFFQREGWGLRLLTLLEKARRETHQV